ncbi:unnamed protein product [Oikopleura dioica]|uniref:Uncharacterized protein n=1 Tax=Oikopleura dioica TaxID=34765 RepID=E4WRB6_OIKDI|nr:unnamed protein product [Oikopleura dioica]
MMTPVEEEAGGNNYNFFPLNGSVITEDQFYKIARGLGLQKKSKCPSLGVIFSALMGVSVGILVAQSSQTIWPCLASFNEAPLGNATRSRRSITETADDDDDVCKDHVFTIPTCHPNSPEKYLQVMEFKVIWSDIEGTDTATAAASGSANQIATPRGWIFTKEPENEITTTDLDVYEGSFSGDFYDDEEIIEIDGYFFGERFYED